MKTKETEEGNIGIRKGTKKIRKIQAKCREYRGNIKSHTSQDTLEGKKRKKQ